MWLQAPAEALLYACYMRGGRFLNCCSGGGEPLLLGNLLLFIKSQIAPWPQVPVNFALPGGPLLLGGPVVSGFGRGSRQLGVPTANIDPVPLQGTLSEMPLGVYFGCGSSNLCSHFAVQQGPECFHAGAACTDMPLGVCFCCAMNKHASIFFQSTLLFWGGTQAPCASSEHAVTTGASGLRTKAVHVSRHLNDTHPHRLHVGPSHQIPHVLQVGMPG